MARPSRAARPKAARSNLPAELSPRERLLRRGAAALSDAELLSVVLLNGSSEAPALRQAVDLLHEVGGFLGLLRLDAAALRGLGLTRCKAAALVSAVELSRRLTHDELPRWAFTRRLVAAGKILGIGVAVMRSVGAILPETGSEVNAMAARVARAGPAGPGVLELMGRPAPSAVDEANGSRGRRGRPAEPVLTGRRGAGGLAAGALPVVPAVPAVPAV